MKITIDIDDMLLREAEVFAAQHGISLDGLVEEGLRMQLSKGIGTRRSKSSRKLPVSLCSGGLQPGIDPGSNVSMQDAADEA